jgi:hypothetical protein
VQAGKEDCDDTNRDNTDGCLVNCLAYDPCKALIIKELRPAVACIVNVPKQLRIVGDGFLRVNGVQPTVTFQGQPAVIRSMDVCTNVGGKFESIVQCKEILIDIPAGLGVGNYQIAVKNAVTKECTVTATFSIGPAPQITTVTPVELCEGRPGNFVIRGSGFTASTIVTFNNLTPTNVTFVSANELNVAFTSLPPGRYNITVSNGAGCQTTKNAAVTVYKNPLAFFVDPEVSYNQISIQSTIYLSGLNGPNLVFVGIRPSGGGGQYTSLNFTFDPNKPNLAKAVIPRNLNPDDYELLIRDGKTCEFVLPNAIKVTNQTTLALDAIDPPFGWSQSQTGVTMTTTTPIGAGQTPFQNGVRIYVNPNGSTGLATSLSAVAFLKSSEITALIPKLSTGDYDVIAVNPDGSVGVLTKGFKVTTNPPPVLDEISPGSIANTGTPTVRVDGSGFATTGILKVELVCKPPTGNTTTSTPTLAARTSTQLTLTIANASTLVDGSICIIRVTNPDGTYGEYSALGVTGPSLNIGAFNATSSLVTARRAPATTSGRPTSAARFLYAIGGDSGTTNGALDTVEAVSVNRFGDLNQWRILPTKLPTRLTHAKARRIGQFIYLVGGNTGTAPSNQAYRAKVLDPNVAPQFNDVSLSVETTGMGPGIWYYRVSAVMQGTDPSNPNGETLAGDPQPIKIPNNLTQKLHIKLTWNAVPGAKSYRIYRTPTANLTSGQEVLLATVNAPTVTYTDTGTATPGTDIPRQVGDLGEWHSAGTLGAAREGLGLGVGRDPTTANTWYLYALMGRSTGNTMLKTYEYMKITINANGTQTMGAWQQDATNQVNNGRWQLAGFSVDRVASTRVGANNTYIYAGPGLGSLTDVNAGKIQTGGKLTSWTLEAKANPGYAGYGFAAAADQLFVFGGQNGSPDTGGKSTEICGPGSRCKATATPPELRGWNAGIGLSTARYLMGTAIESAHIYIIGGTTASGATKTVESTIW